MSNKNASKGVTLLAAIVDAPRVKLTFIGASIAITALWFCVVFFGVIPNKLTNASLASAEVSWFLLIIVLAGLVQFMEDKKGFILAALSACVIVVAAAVLSFAALPLSSLVSSSADSGPVFYAWVFAGISLIATGCFGVSKKFFAGFA